MDAGECSYDGEISTSCSWEGAKSRIFPVSVNKIMITICLFSSPYLPQIQAFKQIIKAPLSFERIYQTPFHVMHLYLLHINITHKRTLVTRIEPPFPHPHPQSSDMKDFPAPTGTYTHTACSLCSALTTRATRGIKCVCVCVKVMMRAVSPPKKFSCE